MKRILLLLLCSSIFSAHSQAPLIFTGYDLNTLPKAYSDPYLVGILNGNIILSAYTDTTGYEPWVCDGTTAGTYLIKNIATQGAHADMSFTTEYGGKVYFSATDYKNGQELWVSDGTYAGTQMVKNICPGFRNSYPSYMTVYNGKMYFSADNFVNGSELWVSDGTTAGTNLFYDINTVPIVGSSAIPSSNPRELILFNGKIFFAAYDGVNGGELWVTDGTVAGTAMLKDIDPGSGSGDPSNFFIWGSDMYFKAKTATTGYELWKTDGTAAGTVMVKDIWPGSGNGLNGLGIFGSPGNYHDFRGCMVYKGELYFTGRDSIHGSELWKTDGTTAGTIMVKDINIYTGGSNGSGCAGSFAILNNELYFVGTDTFVNWELWKTDGTTAGTKLVYDPIPGFMGGGLAYITTYKNHLYFTAQTSLGDWRLLRSDGTDTGTHIIAPPGSTNANTVRGYGTSAWFFYIYPKDSALYFSANFTSAGRELWSLKDTTGFAAMPCDSPTNLTVNSVGAFNAGVSWDTVAGVAQYEYYIAVHPSTPPSGGTLTSSHSVFLTGLSMNTTYDFCVRSRCGTMTSAWVCDTLRTTTDINTLSLANDVRIYPNPSKGTFTVSLSNGYSKNATLTVLDMTGRIVTTKQMNAATETITMGNTAKGIYTIRVVTDNAVMNKRIVIE